VTQVCEILRKKKGSGPALPPVGPFLASALVTQTMPMQIDLLQLRAVDAHPGLRALRLVPVFQGDDRELPERGLERLQMPCTVVELLRPSAST
jgi:hypothetical protein